MLLLGKQGEHLNPDKNNCSNLQRFFHELNLGQDFVKQKTGCGTVTTNWN